ncbi:hypothetical protein ACJMK2_027206 [Sinanodonta woodiana]|uniref:Scavenger receptor cysteine-rich domain-containing protein DMBT1 n=1 Tax=Sinanodonta woodiana TaxID=1069815 RepID=A0ABD3XMF6_SINWO
MPKTFKGGGSVQTQHLELSRKRVASGGNGYGVGLTKVAKGSQWRKWVRDDMRCTGSESDLALCSFSGGTNTWGKENCEHTEDASVRCVSLAIRLVNGPGNWEGRLEVQYAGRWGTVCNTSFDSPDAVVACRMLGFNDGQVAVYGGGYFGKGDGSIMLDGLQCNGLETSLLQCRHGSSNIPTTNCYHSQDVGVSCSHTPVRLVDGAIPSEGRVELQHNGIWGSICSSGFDMNVANVICRMLGFSGAINVRLQGYFGQGTGPVWLDSVRCTGIESDISRCSLPGWGNGTCQHGGDAGVQCSPTKVRLVQGLGPWEGRVELLIGGQWSTVCDNDFGSEEAHVICSMLGFKQRDANYTVYPGAYFGPGSVTQAIDSIDCSGNEHDITNCHMSFHDSSGTCSHTNDVGIRCLGTTVRLVDGAHASEGRVEVERNGTWGTICDFNWNDVDATVVCKMLAPYPLDKQVTGKAYKGSMFGYGDGPVWLSDVRCHGNESDIVHCPADLTGGVNCDHRNDAGVSCTYNEPFRLTGGSSASEGTVESKSNGTNTWSSFCDTQWDASDAKVICRSLGYWYHLSDGPTVFVDSWFGRGNGTPRNVSPLCKGNEGDIKGCTLGIEWGKSTCQHSDDIGVQCTPIPLGRTNIRLVDGPGPWNGRFEVYYNGKWGSVCWSHWNTTYDDIVCRSLHYSQPQSRSYAVRKGYSPVFINKLECSAMESDVGLCKADFNLSDDCGNNVVGIDCSGGTGAFLTERTSGTIGIRQGSSVAGICNNGLDVNGARVVCSLIGYRNTSPTVLTNQRSTSTLNVSDTYTRVLCDGWEEHISQCIMERNGDTSCPNNTLAAVRCFNCTREYVSMTGSLTSELYPSWYASNTDCLYSILPPRHPGMYKLVFHDLKLPSDGDFVEITEGSTGKQLGLFTTPGPVPILVGDSFIVRFKTNAAGNDNGFSLSWSPLTIEDALNMTCSPNGWNIAVNTTILRKIYPDIAVSQIKLSDPHCTGRVFGDLVVFTQSYVDCSTTSMINDTLVIYNNKLVYPEGSNPFPLIVRRYLWKVDVQCDLSRNDVTEHHFKPNQTTVQENHHVEGAAHYSIQLQFFKDPAFYQQITGEPISAKTGDEVYVKVLLNSNDINTKMIVRSCYAKPTPNADQASTYYLIKNGCEAEPDTHILSQGIHETRFVFSAFEFPTNHNSVYIYCDASYCKTSDISPQCLQTCHTK